MSSPGTHSLIVRSCTVDGHDYASHCFPTSQDLHALPADSWLSSLPGSFPQSRFNGNLGYPPSAQCAVHFVCFAYSHSQRTCVTPADTSAAQLHSSEPFLSAHSKHPPSQCILISDDHACLFVCLHYFCIPRTPVSYQQTPVSLGSIPQSLMPQDPGLVVPQQVSAYVRR